MKNTALERLFRLAARMNMDLVRDHKMERLRATAQSGQSSNTLILEQKVREKIAWHTALSRDNSTRKCQ